LHAAGLGEGAIDEQIGEFELLANPTVGLAAHYGRVDIRITAKAETVEMADQLISSVERTIRERLGRAIYGADEETLEDAALATLTARGWKLVALEVNTGGELARQLSGAASGTFIGGKVLASLADGQSLAGLLDDEMKTHRAEVGLALAARPATGRSEVDLVLVLPHAQKTETRGYGGHPTNVPAWGANSALELLRTSLA
jgi:nicotinamide-nucleotide amidase